MGAVPARQRGSTCSSGSNQRQQPFMRAPAQSQAAAAARASSAPSDVRACCSPTPRAARRSCSRACRTRCACRASSSVRAHCSSRAVAAAACPADAAGCVAVPVLAAGGVVLVFSKQQAYLLGEWLVRQTPSCRHACACSALRSADADELLVLLWRCAACRGPAGYDGELGWHSHRRSRACAWSILLMHCCAARPHSQRRVDAAGRQAAGTAEGPGGARGGKATKSMLKKERKQAKCVARRCCSCCGAAAACAQAYPRVWQGCCTQTFNTHTLALVQHARTRAPCCCCSCIMQAGGHHGGRGH